MLFFAFKISKFRISHFFYSGNGDFYNMVIFPLQLPVYKLLEMSPAYRQHFLKVCTAKMFNMILHSNQASPNPEPDPGYFIPAIFLYLINLPFSLTSPQLPAKPWKQQLEPARRQSCVWLHMHLYPETYIHLLQSMGRIP